MRALPSPIVPVILAALALPACNRGDAPPAQTPGQYPQTGQYQPPGGQYQQPGQYPQQPGQYPQQPGQYTPPGQYQPPGQYTPPASTGAGQYTPPAPPSTSPPPSIPAGPPSPNDPINLVDINYLRNNAGSVMGELIRALAPAAQAKVQGIPFIADPTVGEVNAYAACDDQGMPLMAITDGLLQIEAYVAQFKATDEIFGTNKLDGYLQIVAQNTRPHQPIPMPPAGFIDANQSADGRKVARQHQLMDEQLAFVLGHELAHHHLGHTGCANGQGGSRGVNPADLGRLLTRVMPAFNQPNEVAADIAGTNNLLAAGSRQQGTKWNEEGALLTLDYFSRLDQLTPATILFNFENTHPPPQLRRPIVQQTASTWRATGGAGFQLPGLPNIFGG
ncbi:MAG: M48 family metalloprotease [Byssovorax sp.]